MTARSQFVKDLGNTPNLIPFEKSICRYHYDDNGIWDDDIIDEWFNEKIII